MSLNINTRDKQIPPQITWPEHGYDSITDTGREASGTDKHSPNEVKRLVRSRFGIIEGQVIVGGKTWKDELDRRGRRKGSKKAYPGPDDGLFPIPRTQRDAVFQFEEGDRFDGRHNGRSTWGASIDTTAIAVAYKAASTRNGANGR